MERDLQTIHDEFAKRLASGERTLASFQNRIAEKGLPQALRNSDPAFAAAGQVVVYGNLVEALAKKLAGDPKTKLTFESLYDFVMREVVQRASWVSHGSSQTGYLLERCETAAWAKALSYMQAGM
jgi:hypothetical protein